MTTGSEATDGPLAALERFENDNLELGQLERHLDEFDAFAFLRLSWSEQFHSRVLAWLLDPRGNHSVGDFFLKRFLLETCAAEADVIYSLDWSGTTVQREWHNVVNGVSGYLDILIENRNERFVCAIENKVFSDEHSEQLTRYREAVESRYEEYTRRSYLFLSRGGVSPLRHSERKVWKAANYEMVLRTIKATIREGVGNNHEAVAVFLSQYETCLRRTVVPSTDIRKIATRIYLQHRDAVDLIIEHRNGFVDELKRIFKDVVVQQDCWQLFESQPERLVRFHGAEWRQFEAFRAGAGEAPQSESTLHFDFDLRPNNEVNLILTIGPGSVDSDVRKALFDMARSQPSVFKPRGHRLAEFTERWVRLHVSEPILSEPDFTNWDEEMVAKKITAWAVGFAAEEFQQMNKAIMSCFEDLGDDNRKLR